MEILRVHGTRSNATFPLFANGRVFGALAFGMTHVERRWSVDEISGLKLVAQIFGHVISRRHAEARVEQLRDEIQRSTRASELGEIAAALAHEINQPLTTILGNAQAARRFLDQGNADPAEIRAILDDINLISNAIHAMSETPPDQRRIIVRTRSCAKRVDLQIQDRGCGISPEQLARIFEPFHTTRSEGLGMGLAICRRIAESHGGTLHARNDEAGGAVFTCSVPVR